MRRHVFRPLSLGIMPHSLGGGISARCASVIPLFLHPLLLPPSIFFSGNALRRGSSFIVQRFSSRSSYSLQATVIFYVGTRNLLSRSVKQTTEKRSLSFLSLTLSLLSSPPPPFQLETSFQKIQPLEPRNSEKTNIVES